MSKPIIKNLLFSIFVRKKIAWKNPENVRANVNVFQKREQICFYLTKITSQNVKTATARQEEKQHRVSKKTKYQSRETLKGD